MPIPQTILGNPIFVAVFATLCAVGLILVVVAWFFLNKLKPKLGSGEPAVICPTEFCRSHETILFRLTANENEIIRLRNRIEELERG